MGEAVHYELSPSPTNSRDSGLLSQATRPISGSGLPVIGHSTALKLLVYSAVVLFVALCVRRQLQHLSKSGCRTGDSDLGGDISSRSQDSDEDSPSGDLRFNAQALGTGAAEEGVSRSCEDEASGGAAAVAPKPAADEEDDDPDSKRGHPAAGKECGKHTVERQGRARWMGRVAGLLETAGKKISSVAAKSDVAANPAAGGVAGKTAASSSKAPQPKERSLYYPKLEFWDLYSPHYRHLGRPYDFPNLKADKYKVLRQELLKLEESMGNLCSPHSEPFRARVKADCDIRGVGTVTLHIEIVEEGPKQIEAIAPNGAANKGSRKQMQQFKQTIVPAAVLRMSSLAQCELFRRQSEKLQVQLPQM
ncbi:hypothetical protein ENH_00021640 [Eimeria necatrix]|uniref:Uncharacterized protein n=1 Tax=Eimeria necatrix TaxID=51315 RepID=U6MXZ0_9EIME|nr:hypothetical protein ENH_00021640 [Eimeria necatrix]CDJ66530.1 hypothetical protein ENH_00021640 [Eimeria necatrix]